MHIFSTKMLNFVLIRAQATNYYENVFTVLRYIPIIIV